MDVMREAVEERAGDPPVPTADKAASSPRHILPSDLSAAIKYLNDQELDQLQATVTTELQRRGKKPTVSGKTPKKQGEKTPVFLYPGKLKAEPAAFQPCFQPSKISNPVAVRHTLVRN